MGLSKVVFGMRHSFAKKFESYFIQILIKLFRFKFFKFQKVNMLQNQIQLAWRNFKLSRKINNEQKKITSDANNTKKQQKIKISDEQTKNGIEL